MAKLILKQQELPKSSWLTHYGSQVAYVGFIALLLLISLGILVAFKPSASMGRPLPSLSSATEPRIKSQYLQDWEKLNGMQASYEEQAKDVSSYDKALVLLNTAESGWQQLLIMSESTDQLGLNSLDQKDLEEQESYLQDQWQARIHFSELRLDRFSNSRQAQAFKDTAQLEAVSNKTLNPATSVNAVAKQSVAEGQPSNKYIAQPPAGVELPAGFCTLQGAGACKPAASN